MDIQQLTLVLDLLKDVADGALWAFVLYLFVSYVLPYSLGVLVISMIYRLLHNWQAMYREIAWYKKMADLMGSYYIEPYNDSDIAATRRRIEEKLKAGQPIK